VIRLGRGRGSNVRFARVGGRGSGSSCPKWSCAACRRPDGREATGGSALSSRDRLTRGAARTLMSSLVEEMQVYYARRASMYDASMGYDNPERVASLAPMISSLARQLAGRNVLE